MSEQVQPAKKPYVTPELVVLDVLDGTEGKLTPGIENNASSIGS